MDQIQAATNLPHIVQVYQPSVSIHPTLQTAQGKVTYQQTITSESLHIPVSSQVQHEITNHQILSQNQTMMSCQQIHLQGMQHLQPQIIQNDMNSMQITSHVILPQVPVFKQHVITTNGVQQSYYEQYEAYLKDQHCVITKVEPDVQILNGNQIECKADSSHSVKEEVAVKKRCRSQVPNPGKWACNVRKLKHEKGEAYISRRGKYVPERCISNTKDCLRSCKYKCSERINDVDRQHLFKAFYSLNTNEKKHFLLNTTERNDVKHNKSALNKRKYCFKYFFLVRGVRYTVCKNFYLGTLAISQKPVYNVHSGKSDMNLPKPDGRGLSEASAHSLPSEIKDRVRSHIMSFSTIDAKPVKQFSRKKQYLESSLSIKQMYTMYFSECNKDNIDPVKESMYRKILKQEFNLHFKKDKAHQLCCRCKGPIKKK